MDDPLIASSSTAQQTIATPESPRRGGLRTVVEGLGFVAAGFIGLWLSFRFGNGAKAILGAGPLIGGGMVGYGATQAVLGPRLAVLRWVAAVVAGAVTLGATIIVLETTLGVTFG